MQLSALLLSTLPLFASAWHLQLYDKELYVSVLEDRSGTLTQPCKTLAENKVNKAQSMKWNRAGAAGLVVCNVRLYDDNQCRGTKLADAEYGNWNIPNFSSQAKNKVNSYKIDCNE